MKNIAICLILLSGCATAKPLMANDAGITIRVDNTALQDMVPVAMDQAQEHCAQFEKSAKLANVQEGRGSEDGLYSFDCVG